MEIAIFIFYLLLFSYAVTIIPFFKKAALPRWTLPSLFILKVASGVAYALFYTLPRYQAGSDTWRFFRLSIQETKWLISDPIAFTKDLFVHGYRHSGNIFSGQDSYWNDLKSNIPVKLLAIMNLFTNSSYYANIILFNFLFFFGLVALFRLAAQVYQANKWLLIVGIFLLPSTLFWCSGIHKDGLLLSATGLIMLLFYQGMQNRFTVSKLLLICFLLLITFSLRNYVAFALMPALLGWWLATKFPVKKWAIFFGLYGMGVVLFFTLPYLIPAADLPAFIVSKQQEFRKLEGGSEVKLQELQPTFQSYVTYLPSALDMAFLRPHPSEIKNFSYIPAFLEIGLLLLLIAFSLLKIRSSRIEPLSLCFIFFAISLLLVAGYTITLSGAIVRYRSFALPFLLTPLLANLSPFLSNNKK